MNQYRFSLVRFYLGFMVFLILTGGGCSTLKGLNRQVAGSLDASKGLNRQIAGSTDEILPSDVIPTSTRFVQVKAGTFLMGSPSDEVDRDDDERKHKVTLTQDFEIQTTEVTQLQYFLVMVSNPSHFKKKKYCSNEHRVINGEELCLNHPVENVSWNAIQDFIVQLNKADDGYTYGLPTEAQWEYAARGCEGSGEPTDMASCKMTAFNLGDNINTDQVNYNGNHPYNNGSNGEFRGQTVKVSRLPNANVLGLYDMHGNVGEWVADRYGKYSRSHVVDPKGSSSGPHRVFRGGDWSGMAWHVRSADRNRWKPSDPNSGVGFRLMRTAKK